MPFLSKSKVLKSKVVAATAAAAAAAVVEIQPENSKEELNVLFETHKQLGKRLKQRQELLRRLNLVKSYKSRVK